jgi:hypothetical protein
MITAEDRDHAEASAICETCGGLVVWVRQSDGTQLVLHDGCDRPVVTLVCDHPNRIGVITDLA